MRYFLIAGEASGDLHAAHLMRALRERDADAAFQCIGGDAMQAAGGELLRHYSGLAYMGFLPVALHARTILRGMAECKAHLRAHRPDVVILVDYPGFNLSIARTLRTEHLCPAFYYIPPKVWAWKEGRVRRLKRDVDAIFSILPFEKAFFEEKHHCRVTYVGNPTVDEVAAYCARHGAPQPDGRTLALLPGSRRQEVERNLLLMLRGAAPHVAAGRCDVAIAAAPALPRPLYEGIIRRSGLDPKQVTLVDQDTYGLLSHAAAALVTSGTATLETALLGVPQAVCYATPMGHLVKKVQPHFLHVPYISLVNLIAEREVVPELVGSDMNARSAEQWIGRLLPGGEAREAQRRGYAEVARRLGPSGAPDRAADTMLALLRQHRATAQDKASNGRA